MATESYASGVQIKEVRFSRHDVERLLIENVLARASCPYDFDYEHPIVIWDKAADETGLVMLRYVQQDIVREPHPRQIQFTRLRVLAE